MRPKVYIFPCQVSTNVSQKLFQISTIYDLYEQNWIEQSFNLFYLQKYLKNKKINLDQSDSKLV